MKNTAEKYILRAKQWAGSLTDKDAEPLKLKEREKASFNELKDGSYEEWRNQYGQKFDENTIWRSIEMQIATKKKSKVIQLFKYWPSAAAILVIGLLSYQAYFIYSDFQRKQQEALIQPGQSQAYLEIDNTKRIELGSLDTLMLFKKAEVKLESEKIAYTASERVEEKNEYHKINVPRNGEFYLELSDGTKVWMNSESTIGFHSRFDGKQRIVDLTGEAYFEVAKNRKQPFIVRTINANVMVLGTHFNVKAYPDEDYTYATLNEGKVSVSNDVETEILNPDEQLIVNNKNGIYTKRKVDADIYSAWVKGQFVFKDERLEDILHTISRWYDIQVFYEDQKLKEERYSVSINRYDDIRKLLRPIEAAEEVEFEVKGKALVVK
jgi:hypothetical protein